MLDRRHFLATAPTAAGVGALAASAAAGVSWGGVAPAEASPLAPLPSAWAAGPGAATETATVAAKAPVRLVCDQAVSHLVETRSGREVYLVGTAHISDQSALLVGQVIRNLTPDLIMVELDAQRVGRIGSSKVRILEPLESIRDREKTSGGGVVGGSGGGGRSGGGGGSGFGASLAPTFIAEALKQMYKSMDNLGFKSGEEFFVAFREAETLGVPVLLGDQPVKRTLENLSRALEKSDLRTLSSPDFEAKMKAFEAARPGLSKLESVSMDDKGAVAEVVELVKQRDTVSGIMAILKEELPLVHAAMIGDRDKYMARSVLTAPDLGVPCGVVVAVVGLAHVDGMEAALVQGGWTKAPCAPPPATLRPTNPNQPQQQRRQRRRQSPATLQSA